ncbi:unnamed protein product [Cuscuta europaea]|nr:unnamed protein product [Cuscuta europaea]
MRSRRTAPDPTMPPVFVDPRADEWEQRELDKIRKWYGEQEETITKWENENKNKAELKLKKIKAELEEKIARAVENFEENVKWIENTSRKAMIQVEKEKKKEEQKVKEEANQLRFTGIFPEQTTCSLM